MAEEVFKRVQSKSPDPSISIGIAEPSYNEKLDLKESIPRRIWDSFKRDPNAYVTPRGVVGANGNVFDVATAAQATANSPLARKLKGRHLQMIAIGGSIGDQKRVLGTLQPLLIFIHRHRSLRRFWESSCQWRSGVTGDRL